MANGNTRILTNNELSAMKSDVQTMRKYIQQETSDLKYVITAFNDEEIINSFYASGNFGAQEEAELERILKAFTQYNNAISGDGGLLAVTEQYINRQIELNTNGK